MVQVYIRNCYPYFITFITFGFKYSWNSKLQLTEWLFSLFWLLDLIPVLLSFGRVFSVWHFKASNMFIDLPKMAVDNNPYWKKKLFTSFVITLLFPEVF